MALMDSGGLAGYCGAMLSYHVLYYHIRIPTFILIMTQVAGARAAGGGVGATSAGGSAAELIAVSRFTLCEQTLRESYLPPSL